MQPRAVLVCFASLILTTFFIWAYALAQNFIDPLKDILKAVEPGMTEAALRAEIQKRERELTKNAKIYFYEGVISLLWEGDEVMNEGRRPISNLVIQLHDGQVKCVWYRASHFDPFIQESVWDRKNKGGYLCSIEW